MLENIIPLQEYIKEGCLQVLAKYPRLDCNEYIDFFDDQYGGRGDILCIKSKDSIMDFLYIPINMDFSKISEGEMYHKVLVYGDLVYDLKYNNIGVPLLDYLNACDKLTKSGIRADATMSTMTYGLPTKRQASNQSY